MTSATAVAAASAAANTAANTADSPPPLRQDALTIGLVGLAHGVKIGRAHV